jgi:hypothetical protein
MDQDAGDVVGDEAVQVGSHGEAFGATRFGTRDTAPVVQGAQVTAEACENAGQQR